MSTPSTSTTFIIGVAGGSGSGKTTVVKNLANLIGPEKVVCLSFDNYYRDQSQLTMAQRIKTNYDHPNSLETELLISQLKQLKNGQSILEPVYDFKNHTRSHETIKINPAKIIIVEGILLFTEPKLLQMFDLKIFVDTDDDLRFIRRLKRDLIERGRSLDSVVDQYLATVRPMYLQFVGPSKRVADLIIPEGGENPIVLEVLLSKLEKFLGQNDRQ